MRPRESFLCRSRGFHYTIGLRAPNDSVVRVDEAHHPQATDRLVACEIDRGPRGEEKASDHTPVWCELEL